MTRLWPFQRSNKNKGCLWQGREKGSSLTVSFLFNHTLEGCCDCIQWSSYRRVEFKSRCYWCASFQLYLKLTNSWCFVLLIFFLLNGLSEQLSEENLNRSDWYLVQRPRISEECKHTATIEREPSSCLIHSPCMTHFLWRFTVNQYFVYLNDRTLSGLEEHESLDSGSMLWLWVTNNRPCMSVRLPIYSYPSILKLLTDSLLIQSTTFKKWLGDRRRELR